MKECRWLCSPMLLRYGNRLPEPAHNATITEPIQKARRPQGSMENCRNDVPASSAPRTVLRPLPGDQACYLQPRLHKMPWKQSSWVAAGIALIASFYAGIAYLADNMPFSPPPPTPGGNPLGRSPEAVQAGEALFHERCAVCHGQQAEGAMASNLRRARSVADGPANDLFALIRKGIPGTEMPPQEDLAEDSVWQLVSYLHSLARPGRQPPVPGDAEAGSVVFREAGCLACHLVKGVGGFLGPALDSIAVRKTSGQIRNDVLTPGAQIAGGYGAVAIETATGDRIRGLLKHESSFRVIVLTADGQVRSFSRADLRRVDKLSRSTMPSNYGERLSADGIQNLLAFLDQQRAPFVPVRRGFGNY